MDRSLFYTISSIFCTLLGCFASYGSIHPSSSNAKDLANRPKISLQQSAAFCHQPKTDKKLVAIRTPEDLLKIQSGGHYQLAKSIRLPHSFFSIGDPAKRIRNIILDGNGHSIENLTHSLFLKVENAQFKNLRFKDIRILVDEGGVLARELHSNVCIKNVSFKEGWVSGYKNIGSVAGKISGTNVTLKEINNKLDLKNRGGTNRNFGGIVGIIETTTPGQIWMERLSVQGRILSPDADGVGGVIGRIQLNHSGSELLVQDSYAVGIIQGNKRVGGFIGSIEDAKGTRTGRVRIGQSFAKAHVTGKTWLDPTVAEYSEPSRYVGGFVGFMQHGEISNCFSEGFVSGRHSVGGFIGGSEKRKCLASELCWIHNTYTVAKVQVEMLKHLEKAPGLKPHYIGAYSGKKLPFQVVHSFWNQEVSSTGKSPVASGKRTKELRKLETFSEWDFQNVWIRPSKKRYPQLAWFARKDSS